VKRNGYKVDSHEDLVDLIEEYRDRCLWFLRPDYVPRTREEILRTLDFIERYGDRRGFERAEEIKAWPSRRCRQES